MKKYLRLIALLPFLLGMQFSQLAGAGQKTITIHNKTGMRCHVGGNKSACTFAPGQKGKFSFGIDESQSGAERVGVRSIILLHPEFDEKMKECYKLSGGSRSDCIFRIKNNFQIFLEDCDLLKNPSATKVLRRANLLHICEAMEEAPDGSTLKLTIGPNKQVIATIEK